MPMYKFEQHKDQGHPVQSSRLARTFNQSKQKYNVWKICCDLELILNIHLEKNSGELP